MTLNYPRQEFTAVNSLKLVMSQGKKKKESRNESSTSTLDDAFAGGLKNPDCVLILANYLRSLEQQVKEMFDIAKKSSESQIKGEL